MDRDFFLSPGSSANPSSSARVRRGTLLTRRVETIRPRSFSFSRVCTGRSWSRCGWPWIAVQFFSSGPALSLPVVGFCSSERVTRRYWMLPFKHKASSSSLLYLSRPLFARLRKKTFLHFVVNLLAVDVPSLAYLCLFYFPFPLSLELRILAKLRSSIFGVKHVFDVLLTSFAKWILNPVKLWSWFLRLLGGKRTFLVVLFFFFFFCIYLFSMYSIVSSAKNCSTRLNRDLQRMIIILVILYIICDFCFTC